MIEKLPRACTVTDWDFVFCSLHFIFCKFIDSWPHLAVLCSNIPILSGAHHGAFSVSPGADPGLKVLRRDVVYQNPTTAVGFCQKSDGPGWTALILLYNLAFFSAGPP
jgi:hypothetical protein